MAHETNTRETGSRSRGHTNGFLMKLDIGYRLSMCVCVHETKRENKEETGAKLILCARKHYENYNNLNSLTHWCKMPHDITVMYFCLHLLTVLLQSEDYKY